MPRPNSSAEEQYAEQLTLCRMATGMVDRTANQVLRATIDTEVERGPDYRITVGSGITGEARMQISRWPVVQIVSAQVATAGTQTAGGPYLSWTAVPADMIRPEHPAMSLNGTAAPSAAGAGPAALLIAPGYIDWSNGRNGYYFSVTYINGWPHTSLTAACVAGATTLSVDDVTGWTGVRGTIYDGAYTEDVTVSATTPASTVGGPGTVTIGATAYPHVSGAMFSSMPEDIQLATIYFATSMALTRGATATVVPTQRGAAQTSGGRTSREWWDLARETLMAYGRVI